jgi:hypothetical protein
MVPRGAHGVQTRAFRGWPRRCYLPGRTRGSRAAANPLPASSLDRNRERHEVDRVDFDPDYRPGAPIICEVCGGEMRYVAACKILCATCGYRRDCSDP